MLGRAFDWRGRASLPSAATSGDGARSRTSETLIEAQKSGITREETQYRIGKDQINLGDTGRTDGVRGGYRGSGTLRPPGTTCRAPSARPAARWARVPAHLEHAVGACADLVPSGLQRLHGGLHMAVRRLQRAPPLFRLRLQRLLRLVLAVLQSVSTRRRGGPSGCPRQSQRARCCPLLGGAYNLYLLCA